MDEKDATTMGAVGGVEFRTSAYIKYVSIQPVLPRGYIFFFSLVEKKIIHILGPFVPIL